jgi:hypothetical protein
MAPAETEGASNLASTCFVFWQRCRTAVRGLCVRRLDVAVGGFTREGHSKTVSSTTIIAVNEKPVPVRICPHLAMLRSEGQLTSSQVVVPGSLNSAMHRCLVRGHLSSCSRRNSSGLASTVHSLPPLPLQRSATPSKLIQPSRDAPRPPQPNPAPLHLSTLSGEKLRAPHGNPFVTHSRALLRNG